MANFYGTGRTNTFGVKSIPELKKALHPYDFTVIDRSDENNPGMVCVLADDLDGEGGWGRYDPDTDDDFYVPDLIADHLRDGEVAVFVHVGAEKQRYVTGTAVAVHADGRQVRIGLEDIYSAAAAEFGIDRGNISDASY